MNTQDSLRKTDTIEIGGVTKNAPLLALIPTEVLNRIRIYLGPVNFQTITNKLKSPFSNFLAFFPEHILPLLTSVDDQEWGDLEVQIFSNYLLTVQETDIRNFSSNSVNGSIELQGNYLNINIDKTNNIIDESTEVQRGDARSLLEFLDITKFVHFFHIIDGILRDPVLREGIMKALLTIEYTEDGYEIQGAEEVIMEICTKVFIKQFQQIHPNPNIIAVEAYARSTFIPRFKNLFFTIKYQLPSHSNQRLTQLRLEKLSTSLSAEAAIPLKYIRTLEVIDRINQLILPNLPQIETN